MRSRSTLSGSLCPESPKRCASRNTWVSTAIPSTLPERVTEATMLAVLRATPGKLMSPSMVSGTSPSYSVDDLTAQLR
jgi:hypothetical protein